MRLDHLLSKEFTASPIPGEDNSQLMHWLFGFLAAPLVVGFGLWGAKRGSPAPLFRFEGVHDEEGLRALLLRVFPRGSHPLLENSIASTSIFVLQAIKSQRWMPWRLKPMKDVGGCEKPRGAADQASIRGCPNGETHYPSWGSTPA